MKTLLRFFGLQLLRRPTIYRQGTLAGEPMEEERVRQLLRQARSGDSFRAAAHVIEDLAAQWQADAVEASLRPGDEVRHYTGGAAALAKLLTELDDISTLKPEA